VGLTLTCVAFASAFLPVRCVHAGKRRYNIKLWKTFTDCFNCLPVAAIVDEKIFCMHGGLSPELQNMEQIKRIMRPTGACPPLRMLLLLPLPPPTYPPSTPSHRVGHGEPSLRPLAPSSPPPPSL
jgi:hypothetical protein